MCVYVCRPGIYVCIGGDDGQDPRMLVREGPMLWSKVWALIRRTFASSSTPHRPSP